MNTYSIVYKQVVRLSCGNSFCSYEYNIGYKFSRSTLFDGEAMATCVQ